MKVVVLALALSLGHYRSRVRSGIAAQPRADPSRRVVRVHQDAGSRRREACGFTVFGNLGLGLQHDTYYEETAVGLAGSNFGSAVS